MALVLSFVDELLDLVPLKVLSSGVLVHLGLLVDDGIVLLDERVKLIHLVNADVKEVPLLLKLLLSFDIVILELDTVLLGGLHVMEEGSQSDDVELLLVDTSIEEDPLLVQG